MAELNINNRTIFNRDNLSVLRGINSATIDLIYLDPPFNKNKKFVAPVGTTAEGGEFEDIFRREKVKSDWIFDITEKHPKLHQLLEAVKAMEGFKEKTGDKAIQDKRSYNFCYLVYMAVRLIECRRVLKDTGGIYLHCDPTMSHYLKLAMDCIFGERNFRNEIVWQRNDKRGKGSQYKSKKYGSNTDTILFYAKTDKHQLNATLPFETKETLAKFNKTDAKGRRYYSGIPIFRSKGMGDRPNLCFTWKGFKNPHPSGWRLSEERLNEEYEKGNIVITKDGKLERRKYLSDYKGKPLDNNWTDIPRLIGETEAQRKKRLGKGYLKGDWSTGYRTQKPLALLERIIKASSKVGAIVLDPFCGCATAPVAAEDHSRFWIGIDVSIKAYELVKERIYNRQKEMDLSGDQAAAKKYAEAIQDIGDNFTTIVPKRTDDGAEPQNQRFVYVMSNPKFEGYKVGVADKPPRRLGTYQTGDPDRAYKMEWSRQFENATDVENYIHEEYEAKNEWVLGIGLQALIKAIEDAPAELLRREEKARQDALAAG